MESKMKYTIGDFDNVTIIENKNEIKNGFDNVIMFNEYVDEAIGDFDNDEQPVVVHIDKSKHYKTNTNRENIEIVVVDNKEKKENQSSDTDSSSNESGFGTVDDELDNLGLNKNPKTNSHEIKTVTTNINLNRADLNDGNYKPLEDQLQQGKHNDDLSNINSNITYENRFQPLHPLKLQQPRQIMYEIRKNGNNSDDNANILHDNSSMNSSSSSTSNPITNCCTSFIEKINKFYYSCCCCYSTTLQTNQTPLIWSWLSIFCCCCPILGCISLYFTRRSKKLKLKQKYELADKYSSCAEKLNIASLIFGVIFYAIAFFIITLLAFMFWRHNNF